MNHRNTAAFFRVEGILLSRGVPPAVVLGYRASAGPPPAMWHRQVARDVAARIALQSKDFSAKFPTITVSKGT